MKNSLVIVALILSTFSYGFNTNTVIDSIKLDAPIIPQQKYFNSASAEKTWLQRGITLGKAQCGFINQITTNSPTGSASNTIKADLNAEQLIHCLQKFSS